MMMYLKTIAALFLLSTPALAGSYETRCETKQVPYQVQEGAKPGNVVGGALIGGVIGKVATGENVGAAAGAVIGGAVANETGKKTVTRYREVETCQRVFVPEKIEDREALELSISRLNNGLPVSRERTMDVQYTIGTAYDGTWGPNSRRAAEEYLASLPMESTPEVTLYTLVVNDVVIVSSADIASIDAIRDALAEAGVEGQIFTDIK
jgi:hypothetical protein